MKFLTFENYKIYYTEQDLEWKIKQVYEEIFVRKCYETTGVEIGSGDVVIDGGAHLGMFSLYAISKGARKVIAFEPDLTNFRLLAENTIIDLRILIYFRALWSVPGKMLNFRSIPTDSPSSGVVITGANAQAYSETIDNLVDKISIDQVDFIKLDVECSELQALKGAKNTILKYNPKLAIALYHQPNDYIDIPNYLSNEFDYEQVIVNPDKVGIYRKREK